MQLFARLITGKLFDKTGLYNDGRRDTYNKHVYATRDKIKERNANSVKHKKGRSVHKSIEGPACSKVCANFCT